MEKEKEEIVTDIVNKLINDGLNEAMSENPDGDFLTNFQKGMFKMVDKLAIQNKWSAAKKQIFIDKWLDNFNQLKKLK